MGEIAKLLTDAGVPEITARMVKHAADRESAIANLPPPDMLAADAAVLENLRRLLPPDALLCFFGIFPRKRGRENHLQLAHGFGGNHNSLSYNALSRVTIGKILISPNSVEGKGGLGYLKIAAPISENTPPQIGAPQVLPEGFDLLTPMVMRVVPALVPTAPVPPVPMSPVTAPPPPPPPPPPTAPPCPPADPRRANASIDRAMADLVPLVEERLRRQGVTGRHLRLGREAASTDGTAEADRPMAALAHAVALKDGLPVEFAVALIEGHVRALLGAAPQMFVRVGRVSVDSETHPLVPKDLVTR